MFWPQHPRFELLYYRIWIRDVFWLLLLRPRHPSCWDPISKHTPKPRFCLQGILKKGGAMLVINYDCRATVAPSMANPSTVTPCTVIIHYNLDLNHAPICLVWVKYIDPVSPGTNRDCHTLHHPGPGRPYRFIRSRQLSPIHVAWCLLLERQGGQAGRVYHT